MHHPNIVEFHRAFTYKDSTYLVLELCPNGSIMDMIKRRGCLSLPEVRRFTIQLCGAIKYMHTRNVIHRDLKLGNVFLDHQMNVKIGDFGLAAVLASKDELQGIYDKSFSRRTTVCGTPNYIAPEIIQKDKKGHDHKVDLWALGVMVFTMLTGGPPFAAKSPNEIYEKAKNVDYAWPNHAKLQKDGKRFNEIPKEAKDLVAGLLIIDADQRPDPDQVVSYPFFSMNGGNAIPMSIDPSGRSQFPSWLTEERPIGDAFSPGADRIDIATMARQCGVGLLDTKEQPFPVVGKNVNLSLYKECSVEEEMRLGPIVPLPPDMVYASTTSLHNWPNNRSPNVRSQKEMKAAATSSMPPKADTQFKVPAPVVGPRLATFQSHAATLRAAEVKPYQSSNPRRPVPVYQDSGTVAKPEVHKTVTARSAHAFLYEQPVRRAASIAVPRSSAEVDEFMAVATEKLQAYSQRSLGRSRPQTRARLPRDAVIEATNTNPDKKREEMALDAKAGIAVKAHQELEKAQVQDMKARPRRMPARPKVMPEVSSPSTASSRTNAVGVIGPDEVTETIPSTAPNQILASLKVLHRKLSDSLNGVAESKTRMTEIEIQSKQHKHRPVVTKWVDYSQKFGAACILDNGTAGMIAKVKDKHAACCLAVANADGHIYKRLTSSRYLQKHQIVSKDGAPVEFYEHFPADGIRRVLNPPKDFQLRVDPVKDAAERIDFRAPDLSEHDREKRRLLDLYDKFGRYMVSTLGREGIIQQPSSSRSRKSTSGAQFVRYYQRVGNVGVWGFGDNSVQVNFPDHTKIVVSADGAWIECYCLSVDATRTLAEGKLLTTEDLLGRQKLCYPTDIILCGQYLDHDFQDISQANQLREKLIFLNDLVQLWTQKGGYCDVGEGNHMKWQGLSEPVKALVWSSVGCLAGDARYEKQEV